MPIKGVKSGKVALKKALTEASSTPQEVQILQQSNDHGEPFTIITTPASARRSQATHETIGPRALGRSTEEATSASPKKIIRARRKTPESVKLDKRKEGMRRDLAAVRDAIDSRQRTNLEREEILDYMDIQFEVCNHYFFYIVNL